MRTTESWSKLINLTYDCLKTTNFLNEHQIKFLEEKHPLGFGNAEDLFHSIDFLIDSKKSRWITGTNFILDGGYLI